MNIFYNILIPFPGYSAMMVFGVIFARWQHRRGGLSRVTIRHEEIHRLQALDFMRDGEHRSFRAYLRFYLIYIKQWLKYGYKGSPFEQEAKQNETNFEYLDNRQPYAWRAFE